MLDLRAGVMTAVMANLWGKKESGESYAPEDFFPSLKNEHYGEQTPHDLEEQVKKNIAAMQMFTWYAQAQGMKPA